ncbi:MAG: hypothetical protein IJX06_04835 [Clostridia bacterium]|nr:hypothetical protein [Clostridia bacterium]
METMLQTVVIVFMLFLCALCLFAVVVIARDIIYENAKMRRDREKERALEKMQAAVTAQPVSEVIEQPVAPAPAPEPTPEPEVVEEVVATAEEEEEDENAVAFSRHTLTMEEKYATLSTEFKRYFDDIAKHALGKEGVKEFKFGSSYDYKIGSYRVVRMMIKRSEIVCEFKFIDRDFRTYVGSNNVKMKQSATAVRVLDASAVGVAKDGIDLVCTQIAEDKQYKKELAKEKRREKRKEAKENE